MKQTIIDLLKTKFEGVDESILSRIADTKAAKAVKTDEEANAYVEGVTLNHLLNSYGDIRSTEAQRTAVSNYEKKYGLKDGKKAEGGGHTEPKEDDDDDIQAPAWAKSLIEQNRKLSEEVAAMKGEKVAATRRSRFDELVGKLPEEYRRGYARIALDTMSDDEFSKLLEDVGTEVDNTAKSIKTNGTTFGIPVFRGPGAPGEKGEASKERVDAVLARL